MTRPIPFAPVRLCLHGFQRSSCEAVADEIDSRAADKFAFRGKGSYGLNHFGHSTTGKYNCQADGHWYGFLGVESRLKECMSVMYCILYTVIYSNDTE